MSSLKPSILFIGIVSIISTIYSCSTEKDALINRVYHNTTAHYNGYFNANLLIDEAMESFYNVYIEDYNDLLAPDLFPDQESVPNMIPNIDTAISKCTRVIVKHSMPNPQIVQNKSDEHCRWIDDNWFVIGYANYVKRNYPEAIEKLKYVTETYNGEKSVYIAEIYLAKSYTAMGDYRAAQQALDNVKKGIDRTEEEKNSEKEKSSRSKSKYQKKKEKERKKEAKKDRL